jgi:hypothetical protein
MAGAIAVEALPAALSQLSCAFSYPRPASLQFCFFSHDKMSCARTDFFLEVKTFVESRTLGSLQFLPQEYLSHSL